MTRRFSERGFKVEVSPATKYFYTLDHLGSVRQITNSAGVVQGSYDYDPYGKMTKSSAGDMDPPFGYAGYMFHKPSGLNLTWYRAYDPRLGRWFSRDPIGEAGGRNLYGYVGNDPINRLDLLGLTWIYHQSTGQLEYQPNSGGAPYDVGQGYSGNGQGLNNPSMENVVAIGPIPSGLWDIGPAYNSTTGLGPVVMNLDPADGTNTFGRSLFRIHGDNACVCQSASNGCIILPRDIRERISNSGDTQLQVIE